MQMRMTLIADIIASTSIKPAARRKRRPQLSSFNILMRRAPDYTDDMKYESPVIYRNKLSFFISFPPPPSICKCK